MRAPLSIAMLSLLWGPLAFGDEPPTTTIAVTDAFKLTDISGKQHTAAEWKGKKAIVLLLINAECPVSNHYCPEYTRLADSYAPKGVVFYAVHCDQELTAAEASQHAKDYKLTIPVLLDGERKLAAAVGARVTPEAAVLLPSGELVYRGRIDDRYAPGGKRRDEPSTHDLQDALDAVLQGHKPAVAETKAFGCPLPKLATSQNRQSGD